jgi:putative DNA primase/helicase
MPEPQRITLATLAPLPCWVAWQKELRGKGKNPKPTKLPYNPRGKHPRMAMANDAATWGTRQQAAAMAARLPRPYGIGGIGIEFTMLDDGRNTGGVDLDTCRDPATGALTGWAQAIVDQLATYTEVSPSGEGVKAFFTFASTDFLILRQALGKAASGELLFSKNWKPEADGDHPPGVEMHLGNRYFAVTDQILDGCTDELREVPTADLLRLIQVDLPAFLGTQPDEPRPIPDEPAAKPKRGSISRADRSRSAEAFKVGGAARREGATFEQMCQVIREHPDTAEWYREKGEALAGRELRRIWEKTDPASDELILNPGMPLISARRYLQRLHTLDGVRTMHHQNGTFYSWRTSHYIERSAEEMRADLYAFLDKAKQIDPDGEIIDFSPTKNKVANVIEAAAAEAQLSRLVRPPAWLGAGNYPKAAEVIACANVLLHLPTGDTHPHTPAFFTLNALDFDYDKDATEPTNWLAFLASVWPNDQQAIDTLQEMFGLTLTGETRYQKAFLLVGPKRSGKGTIARVHTQLLGADNVCGPTLSGLGTNFGLAPLIGKRVAIISDARLSGKADQQVIVERLLSITGEDGLTIDRKFRDGWTGKLDARFVILTNEMPRLTDSSGALASRFVILRMTQSFYGKEDLKLGAKLSAEMPGILRWAIEGWKRLTERGHFITPESSKDAQRELEDLGSPIGAFLRDVCMVGQGHSVRCDELYEEWCRWCSAQGRGHAGTKNIFGRDLSAAIPGLKTVQHTHEDGTRPRYYEGVTVDPDQEAARHNTRAGALCSLLASNDSDPYGPSVYEGV